VALPLENFVKSVLIISTAYTLNPTLTVKLLFGTILKSCYLHNTIFFVPLNLWSHLITPEAYMQSASFKQNYYRNTN